MKSEATGVVPAGTAVPAAVARQLGVLGLRWDGDILVLGVSHALTDAQRASATQIVESNVKRQVRLVEVDDAAIREMIEIINVENVLADLTLPAGLESASEGPIAELVNNVLDRAVHLRASDVHVEPQERELLIRFRVDGALEEFLRLPTSVAAPFVSRLKVLAKINIVERRRPQDGQFSVQAAGRVLDVRLATAATLYGEKAALRLLDTKRAVTDLAGLGMAAPQSHVFNRMIEGHYGMVIAAGPTGSGKTTTLHSALRTINTPDRNVTTLEDPVEYVVEGINHMPVNESIGAGFAVQLRAILRQDPDVVLVGEVRDGETARIAVQAALAGRLVLTSLHAPDALGVIYRMFQMEIEPHLVAASVRGVVAQRLLRRVCQYCAVPHEPSAAERILLDRMVPDAKVALRRGAGCSMCRGTGFRDRIGAFQILEISDRMRELISKRPDPHQLYELAESEGLRTIADEAYLLAAAGQTTLDEVARLVGTDG